MSKKRVFLGLSIIAGGVCASLPFRRELPVSLPVPADSSTALPSRSISPLLEPSVAATPAVTFDKAPSSHPSGPNPYADVASQLQDRKTSKLAQTMPSVEEITASSKDNAVAPPMLPVSFQVKAHDEGYITSWQPAKQAEGPSEPPREYRIRKLDTLEDLAERYLGSKERAEELFESNRGILKDRHILPLGAVIRIPSTGVGSPVSSSDSDLQPVRPVSDP